MKTVELKPDVLKSAPINANRMEPDRKLMLSEIIRTKGFLQPILVRQLKDKSYEIVDGHHRVEVAKELGLKTIPCVVGSWDDQTAQAIALGMNRLRGEVDIGIATKVLNDLVSGGWDAAKLTITGFAVDEVADMVKAAGAANTDDFLKEAAAVEFDSDAPGHEPVFSMEFRFTTRDELKAVRKALRKASRPSKDLVVGLKRVLEIE